MCTGIADTFKYAVDMPVCVKDNTVLFLHRTPAFHQKGNITACLNDYYIIYLLAHAHGFTSLLIITSSCVCYITSTTVVFTNFFIYYILHKQYLHTVIKRMFYWLNVFHYLISKSIQVSWNHQYVFRLNIIFLTFTDCYVIPEILVFFYGLIVSLLK